MILKVATQKLLFCRGRVGGGGFFRQDSDRPLKLRRPGCFRKHLPFDAVVLSSPPPPPRHPPHTPPPPLLSQLKNKIFSSFSQRLRTAAVHPSEGLCQILYESLAGPSEKAFIPRTSFSWLADDRWACQRPIGRGGGRGLVVAEAGSYRSRFARRKIETFSSVEQLDFQISL